MPLSHNTMPDTTSTTSSRSHEEVNWKPALTSRHIFHVDSKYILLNLGSIVLDNVGMMEMAMQSDFFLECITCARQTATPMNETIIFRINSSQLPLNHYTYQQTYECTSISTSLMATLSLVTEFSPRYTRPNEPLPSSFLTPLSFIT